MCETLYLETLYLESAREPGRCVEALEGRAARPVGNLQERVLLEPTLLGPVVRALDVQERKGSELGLPPTVTPRLVLRSRLLSIRVPLESAIVACALCANPFSAHGPTGYSEEQPICDRCLLEQESQLGMLLALSSFTRSCVPLADEAGEAAVDAACEMLAFAKVYELFSARFGPPRPLDFNAFAAVGTIS